MPLSGAPGSSQGEFAQMWRRQLVWWHVWFAAGVAATGVAVAMTDPGPLGRLPEFGLLAIAAIAYAVIGAPGVAQERPGWGTAYLAIAWSAVLGCVALNPDTSAPIMFFVLFPQLWSVVRTPRQGVAASVVVVGGYATIGWLQAGSDSSARWQVFFSAAFSLGLSLGLGLFILRLVAEAQSRAATIDALRQAQAQLAAAERDRGVSAERERLSREIHDTLAQGFTSVLSLGRAASAALARGDVALAEERLALIERAAADNLREARLIVAELTPGHLQSRTLTEAIERLVSTLNREGAMPVTLQVVGEPVPLDASAEVLVLRAAQECLANARRHAAADAVTVTVDFSGSERVTLTITDDGEGFDPTLPSSGFGLDGMRARARDVGGSVVLTSAPGAGTSVRVEVPR
ncbi:MAG TPA: sensor histidine kinase [Dermatophilaceae bacterium]|jgi:signal transduction histidine kinase|nr:sensor histidine kinase [Actinomycetales bacterium]HMT31579.1 sensor histidine kinase [Dermatophilaceae bacterium]HMT88330.1 sensor histidine kinase [Dermatophilaceae bacterium]